jgi:uroporphyrinogen decarboxylase
MNNTHLLDALEGRSPGKVPFIPAVYEHKAWFVDQTTSTVCRDRQLFFRALIQEYETLHPDALTVGLDVYNVEAEALGCRVTYYDDGDTSIPAVSGSGHLRFDGTEQFRTIPVPNPVKDGRMPLFIDTAKRIAKELGDEVPIRGAVSGPFSMAVTLFGTEKMFILAMSEPEEMKVILQKCTDVGREYGAAFIDAGCGVVIFDSQATPELISPEMYRDLIKPYHRQLVESFRNAGSAHVPLIIGGDTTPIIDDYIATGANNILCDAPADHKMFREQCSLARRAYRRNIPTAGFLEYQPDRLYDEAVAYLSEAGDYPGFILGTGVVPYGTPTDNITAIGRAVADHRS